MSSKKILIISLLSLLSFSCTKDLIEEYDNQPSKDDIFTIPENVESISEDLYHQWFMVANSSWSPRMAMWVMADQGTCSWANVAMYHLSSEPRESFNNLTSYTYSRANEEFYQDLYAVLTYANAAINAVNVGILEDTDVDPAAVKSQAFLAQGLTLGYLGLIYDKAFIVDETMNDEEIQNLDFSSFDQVIDKAMASFDSVMVYAGPSSDIYKLANSYAARILIHKPRNANQNAQLDWNKIKNYAENGITEDLNLLMDDDQWISYWRQYTIPEDWARIDCRIINLMDPDYPNRFPENGNNPPQAQSEDQRLNMYFTYIASHDMKPERGYYHFSNYDYRRYDYAVTTLETDITEMMAYEMELIKAEALVYLGDVNAAIDILNAGPRTSEDYGNLQLLTYNMSSEEVLEIIFYERDIELIMTGFGIAFFDMRRRDMLQYGTMLHFPVPGKELDVLELPYYSFGGESNADGINTSNGGWFPEK